MSPKVMTSFKTPKKKNTVYFVNRQDHVGFNWNHFQQCQFLIAHSSFSGFLQALVSAPIKTGFDKAGFLSGST